jgi:hypothetical protein
MTMMPFYYDSEATDVLQQHVDGKNLPPPTEPTGTLKTIGMGLARGGLKLAKGAAITASALNENPEGIYRMLDKYVDPAIRSMTPDPHTVSMAGQIIGAVSELPGQLLLGPVGLLNSVVMNTGADLVDAGVSPGAATLAAIGSGAATAGMIAMPQAGTTIAKTAGLAALNPVLGAGTDVALKTGLEQSGFQQQADAINPLDPASRAVDLIMGGVFGALGYRGHLITERAKTHVAESNAKAAKDYQVFVDQMGGHDAIMEKLPVEVVDALSVAKDYQKRIETNPYDGAAGEWLDVHLGTLSKALNDLQETGRVDVSGTVPDVRRESLMTPDDAGEDPWWSTPKIKTEVAPEVSAVREAMTAHGADITAELHAMGGSEPVIDEPAQVTVSPAEPLPMVDEQDNAVRKQRLKAFKEKYGYEPGVKVEATPETTPQKTIDPLSRSVDNLFEERGDFTVYQGKNADGADIHTSAQELVQNAREELNTAQDMKDVYQRAAACMGIGV